MTLRAQDPIEVKANATFTVSPECGGGNGGTFKEGAKLMLWRLKDQDRHGTVEMIVPEGKVFPACGKLYRLVGFLPSGGFVIDKAPVAPPAGVSLRADALAIPVGATGQLGTSRIGVEHIGAAGATLSVREVEFGDGPDEPPTNIEVRKVEVTLGAKFTVLGTKCTVIGIVRPDVQGDLIGWVEITTAPTN
jgi:hypothetical protein